MHSVLESVLPLVELRIWNTEYCSRKSYLCNNCPSAFCIVWVHGYKDV